MSNATMMAPAKREGYYHRQRNGGELTPRQRRRLNKSWHRLEAMLQGALREVERLEPSETERLDLVGEVPTEDAELKISACPVCHVGPGERCVTKTGNPAKQPHKGRHDDG